MKIRPAQLASLSPLLIACGIAGAQQWTGPTGPQNRLDYVTGNVYVGSTGFFNSVVRSDVVDDASTGRIITFHAFAGTPSNAERTTAIWGETNNPAGRALQGFNFSTTGSGAGIWAETAADAGNGLRCRATSTTGANFAGYFDAASTAGTGVYATATSSTGSNIGVWGNTQSSGGYAGYFTGGRNYFEGNVGIGTANPSNRLVVTGSASDSVQSNSNASTNFGFNTGGPSGLSASMTSASSGIWSAGVWGFNNGTGTSGIGVAGYQAGQGFGIYGHVGDSVNGYAGYFEGRVNVTGNLSKGAGSFKIDHPLDPENKYLYHSFVESPDMMNIYNGMAYTDENGYATITMPDYFEALNRDFRYQLTVIDEADANWVLVKVVREISGNEFTIRTSAPSQKVSWQVTGIRHDAYANQNRIPNAVDKEPQNRGHYVHPAAFGQPMSKVVSYQIESKSTGTAPANQLKQAQPSDPVRQAPKPTEPPLVPAVKGGH